MRFKDWFLLNEAGHTTIRGGPRNISVLFQGKPTVFQNVTAIDPRFEFQNLPKTEKSRANKFMGEDTYSLPLVGARGNVIGWIVSHRMKNMEVFSGVAMFSDRPEGIRCPENWADYAILIDDAGFEAKSVGPTFGAAQAVPQDVKKAL